MSAATPSPESALAPHIDAVRLHAEAALVRRFNAGYGFADARIAAETYLHHPETRERMARDALRPQDTHADQAAEIEQALARARDALADHASPLTVLAGRFGLDAAERALLAVAVAYELDRDVRALCHALAGNRGPLLFADVCQELAPALASAHTMLRILHPGGRLCRGCLIVTEPARAAPGRSGRHGPLTAALAGALAVDRHVLDWLLGDERLAEPLDAVMHVRAPDQALPVYLDDAVLAQIDEVAARLAAPGASGAPGLPPLVLIQGASGSGKQAVAHRLAARLGRALAVAPLPGVRRAARAWGWGWTDDARLLRQVLAQARMRGAVAYLPGVEALAADHGDGADRAGSGPAGETDASLAGPHAGDAMHGELARHGELAILATREQGMPALDLGRPFHLVHIPAASLDVRRRAWAHGLGGLAGPTDNAAPGLAGATDDLAAAADDLAARYVIGPGAVGEVVNEARAFARARGVPVGRGEIEQAVGRRLTMRLGPFGSRITRRARIEDMVLPEDVHEGIAQMISMVRERARILEQWGYGRHLGLSRGVSALFSGEPGTGKTMAASVISGALGLDLFRIDLSAITSKWVGETEKHLARIFDEAQSANAMLLFDEADSLFGKRSEVKSAQDRYANLEVNYVLQRMESFDGVSVLTTNLESAIDQAFLRRLNFRIRFPAPEPEERAALWRRLLPPETGLAGSVDVQALADRFVMTGGYIRNAIVRAAVIAAREDREPTERDLWAGAHQEYVELGKVMPSLLD